MPSTANFSRVSALLALLFLKGCYPAYTSEKLVDRGALVAEAQIENEFLIVEPDSLEECIKGSGQAAIVAALSSDGVALSESTSYSGCDTFRFPSAVEVFNRIPIVRSAAKISSPEVPIIKGRPTEGVFEASGGLSSLWLRSDSSFIQIVYGSYGNREGLEVEHVYDIVTTDHSVRLQTRVLLARAVQLEALSGF